MAELIFKGMKFEAIEAIAIKKHSKDSLEPIIIDGIATKEGVWKGVFRPGQLIKDNVKWLKGKPITLNHPPMSTGGKAFAGLAVGQILDAWYIPEGHQAGVKCELWPQKLPGETLQKINDGQILDLSTGFYAAEEPGKGVWSGKDFEATEKSLDFDHVALVPIGACSQADGCGLGLHAEDLSKIDLTACSEEQLNEHLNKALGWTCALHHSAEDDPALPETKGFLDRVVGEMLQKAEEGLKSNVFSLTPCKRDILLHSFDRVSESIKGHSLEEKEANPYKVEADSKERVNGDVTMTKEDGKEGGKADLTFEKATDLTDLLTKIEGLKPEEQAAQALLGLKSMAGMWSGQKGPFTPAAPTFPVPAVAVKPGAEAGTEQVEITWTDGKTPDEAKQAISTAITGFHSKTLTLQKTVGELTEKVSSLGTELQTVKAHSAKDAMSRIKLHSGLSDEEMKAYDGLSPETLGTIADHFQRLKGHSGDQQTNFPPADKSGKGKGGKRTVAELNALNDQMDSQLGIKKAGKQ